MATEKWSAYTSRGTVLTTELNALGSGSYSAAGSAYDNTSNLDMWGAAVLVVTYGTNPTADSTVSLWALVDIDGTNYEDGSASLRPSQAAYLGVFQLYANTSAQRIRTDPFLMSPTHMKFIVLNSAGQTMAATLNTVTLFTRNRTIA